MIKRKTTLIQKDLQKGTFLATIDQQRVNKWCGKSTPQRLKKRSIIHFYATDDFWKKRKNATEELEE